MDLSLPVPPAQDQDIIDFAGHTLSQLARQDTSAFIPPSTSEATIQHTLTKARAWITRFQQRLPAKLYNRFLEILSQCALGPGMHENPRAEFARLFAEANESALWDEFFHSFFHPWRQTQVVVESESKIADVMIESRDAKQTEVEIWEELEHE